MKKLKLIIIGLVIFSGSGFSQTIDLEKDCYWIDGGLGNYYSIDKAFGFTGNINVNLLSNKTYYKINFYDHEEFLLFGPDPTNKFYSVGASIGKIFSNKYAQVQISGGLGIIGGVMRGKLLYTEPSAGWFNIGNPNHYAKDKFITPSIPIAVDLLIKPIKYLGIGVSLFGNLNYKQLLYGVVFKFALGKLR